MWTAKRKNSRFPFHTQEWTISRTTKTKNVSAWLWGVEGSAGGAGISSEEPLDLEGQVHSWPFFHTQGVLWGSAGSVFLVKHVCFSMLVCPERSQYAADWHHLCDITHKSSTTGQIKHSASQLELLGDSEREVAVSCWCVCVNPVGTKPPLAPPLSFKLHHSINLRKLECCGNSDKVMPSSKVSQHKWKELNFTQGGWSQECY